MWKAVSTQAAATLLGLPLAWLLSGATATWFYFLGAVAVLVPSALFALRLWLHRNRSPESYPVVFALGELIKIGLTLGALAWIFTSYQKRGEEVVWLALLIGVIVVLKAPLALIWLDRK
jgi:ATP synthase protein I